ncbi:MAG: T9SS type A sorting domain-containing protein [Bacteroidales bacterium]|nr:T9SS type A sorting domain-containing protein [Bacteroidales bacterium]
MKKNLFTIVMLMLTVLGHGQDTTAAQGFKSFFGQESTEWYGWIEVYDWGSTEVMSCNHDTLIDDVSYKVINFIGNSHSDFLLREDTVTGKLWCRYIGEDEDHLIVDMSLAIGDTLKIKNLLHTSWGDSTLYVVADTTYTDLGLEISLRDIRTGFNTRFIEGVGCSNLFEYSRYNFYSTVGSDLLCCFHDGAQIYHEGYQDSCYKEWVGLDETDTNHTVEVYPNPCQDWITIGGDDINAVSIIDMTGIVLYSNTCCRNPINVSHLPCGFYLLRTEANHRIHHIKLIKI